MSQQIFSCVSLVAVSAGVGMRFGCRWRAVKASDGSRPMDPRGRAGVNMQSTACMEGQRGHDRRLRWRLTKSRQMKSASQGGPGAGVRGFYDASDPLDEGHTSRSRMKRFPYFGIKIGGWFCSFEPQNRWSPRGDQRTEGGIAKLVSRQSKIE